MPSKLNWEMEGELNEVRELWTKDRSRCWGKSFKILGHGETHEPMCFDPDKFPGLVPGEIVRASGSIESRNGRLSLIVESINPVKSKAGAA